MKHKKAPLGFTLIELLIVVAIIGILAAIAVPNFLNARTRSNIARVRADQKSICTALDMYHMDNNCYIETMGGASEFFRLTSPVAYLASVPVDIFLPYTGSKGGIFSRNPDDKFPTFDYTSNDWFTASVRTYPHAFVMESVGPDRIHLPEVHTDWAVYRANPPAVFNKYIYNPTNGIKSYGSILRGGGQGRTFAED
ncbi:MAG TPA: prepilin-type N-terminal cleavage/methylation domain-containing protein [bacterium]|nr:prepilin-type N-terminal cleavage/methylation domain-containing protein [bacterium]HQP97404.1 prepilin-type N-terminal cleavage/methylation domain-containing protein [bacterium]